jgi:hypothetical protein
VYICKSHNELTCVTNKNVKKFRKLSNRDFCKDKKSPFHVVKCETIFCPIYKAYNVLIIVINSAHHLGSFLLLLN